MTETINVDNLAKMLSKMDTKIDKCEAAIHALVDEISKLQHRVKELEENHIHHQDVICHGVTGEPVFRIKENRNDRNN